MITPDRAIRALAALDRLAKWRAVFARWQLGTRPEGDPEGDAVRDHRELTINLRAEMSALSSLLIRKGVISGEEWASALEEEANQLCKDYENRFPGVTATNAGLTMDRRVLPWMKGWKP